MSSNNSDSSTSLEVLELDDLYFDWDAFEMDPSSRDEFMEQSAPVDFDSTAVASDALPPAAAAPVAPAPFAPALVAPAPVAPAPVAPAPVAPASFAPAPFAPAAIDLPYEYEVDEYEVNVQELWQDVFGYLAQLDDNGLPLKPPPNVRRTPPTPPPTPPTPLKRGRGRPAGSKKKVQKNSATLTNPGGVRKRKRSKDGLIDLDNMRIETVDTMRQPGDEPYRSCVQRGRKRSKKVDVDDGSRTQLQRPREDLAFKFRMEDGISNSE